MTAPKKTTEPAAVETAPIQTKFEAYTGNEPYLFVS